MANVQRLTSRSNPLLVRLRKLASDPQAYRKQGQVWLEGEHLCNAYASRGAPIAQALIGESAWQRGPCRELALRAQAVAVMPDALMATLSNLDSPAPLAFVVAWPGAAAARAQGNAGPPQVPLTAMGGGLGAARPWGLSEIRPAAPSIVLDRVQDAGNVGTMLRSAAAFGFTQVLALEGSAGLWSPKVLRAGMGAHFALHLVEGLDPFALSALAIPLLAADAHGATLLHEAQLPWPCAWVFGHEGQGIAPGVLLRCGNALRIAQPGGEESLNVAAAAAVCMYESVRQRSAPGSPG